MIRTTPCLFLILTTLAGCFGGSGGGGGGDTDVAPGLFFGSTDPAQSANGLAFADDSTELEDIANQDIKIRLLTNATRPASGGEGLILSNEIANISNTVNFTVTIDGEEIVFTGGRATGPNGEDLAGRFFAGRFSGFLNINENNEGVFGDRYSAVFGPETNPATIEALTGTTRYALAFSAPGAATINQTDTIDAFFTGGFSLTADFASGTVQGDGNGRILGAIPSTGGPREGLADVDFDIPAGDITGNGFVADFDVTACGDGATCASNSEIGGVFFGPNAEELAGLTNFDITVTDNTGDMLQFEGGGSFGQAD